MNLEKILAIVMIATLTLAGIVSIALTAGFVGFLLSLVR